MRGFLATLALTLTACCSVTAAPTQGDDPITPIIELQSGPLTPGLALKESPRPVSQIRLLVDANIKRGTLVLDGNKADFNEFGELIGGLQTPHVRAESDARMVVHVAVEIEFLKEGPDRWRLYRLRGEKIQSPLRIATRGSIASGGPSRLLVLDDDDDVTAVIECTRYGLVVP